METNADLAGSVNTSYVGALNFWLLLPNVTSVTNEQTVFDIGASQVRINLVNGAGADVGKLYVQIAVSGTDGSPAFSSRTSAHTQADGWLHIQASWNTLEPSTSCLFVNDVSDNNLVTKLGYRPCEYVAVSPAQASMGAASATTVPGQYGASFDISEFWFSEAQYVDFTNAAVRSHFEAQGGHPAFLGADGSLPTGSAPIVYFPSSYSSFGTNAGTGGNFTFFGKGVLAASATAP